MQVILCNDANDVATKAANWVQALLESKSPNVLGLATGSTPVLLYEQLIERYRSNKLSFSDTTTFNLDEYHDIPSLHPQSYRSFMHRHLFDHINIDVTRTFLPTCGMYENPRIKGLEYEQAIKKARGIDLQILGIGSNGHIGFNEPTSSLNSRTRLKTLTRQTLIDNSRLFSPDEKQPTMAMTMGIATIMEAQYVMLLATGKAKANAVKQMITGPVSAFCPASILQMHQHAVVILDKEAASLIPDQDYFKTAEQENQRLLTAFRLNLCPSPVMPE